MPAGICPFAQFVPGLAEGAHGGVMAAHVGFCDHTAGGFMSTMRDVGFWNRSGNSVHFAVGRDGSAIQLLNIFTASHGQGRDQDNRSIDANSRGVTWGPWPEMSRRNPNSYLIATEHEDAELVAGRTRFIPGSEWTAAQYATDLRIKRWCLEEVRRELGRDVLRFGLDSLAGHHMFDPVNRAECPGRFWREVYRASLYRDLTGVAPETEADMYHLIDIYPPFTQGLRVPDGAAQAMNVYADFFPAGVPEGLRAVDIDFRLRRGYLEVYHGGPGPEGQGGTLAGQVGWGVASGNASNQLVRVVPNPAGWITVQARSDVELFDAHGVAYWT